MAKNIHVKHKNSLILIVSFFFFERRILNLDSHNILNIWTKYQQYWHTLMIFLKEMINIITL